MRLRIRPAQPADAPLYFDWANDPVTRQQSFQTDPISWETHKSWFIRKLTDPNALLLVFDYIYKPPVGQVRFERTADEVVISLSVDPRYRGQGLAPEMIREGIDMYRSYFQRDSLPIHAYIKPDNAPSIRSFERAGFAFSHESDKFGVDSKVYRWSE